MKATNLVEGLLLPLQAHHRHHRPALQAHRHHHRPLLQAHRHHHRPPLPAHHRPPQRAALELQVPVSESSWESDDLAIVSFGFRLFRADD
jgi:hypothetical protein